MKKFKKILSKVFGTSPQKINDGTSPEDVKSWDSFHGLLLITELEHSYSIKFTIDDILSIRNVGDIKKNLKKYGVEFEE
jgi:acyl carrier protein